ncbi:hypothetical protein ACQPW1_30095 [Nocardia sp. CA-128927]
MSDHAALVIMVLLVGIDDAAAWGEAIARATRFDHHGGDNLLNW